MDPRHREILHLAEEGAWNDVIFCLEEDQTLGQVQDDFGMTPLHWACTEPSISLDSFSKIVNSCVEACLMENLSGMLPIHVAVTNRIPGLHISALLQKYPEATFIKDRTGKYPIEIASHKNLPRFTTDLIKKASVRAVRSSSLERASSSVPIRSFQFQIGRTSSFEDISSPSFLTRASSLEHTPATSAHAQDNRISEYGCLPSMSLSGGSVDSNGISNQLKDLLLQLQQLSVDIRTSSSSSGASTERTSSTSSSTTNSSSVGRSFMNQVLWNPRDKLGIVFEPLDLNKSSNAGARIKKFASKSNALGIETLSIGDVLVSINGINVQETSHSSILRFLKHVKVTCKLGFMKPSLMISSINSNNSSTRSFDSQEENLMEPSLQGSDPKVLFSKVNQVLEMTLQKVSQVEESVRLSSVMSLCP